MKNQFTDTYKTLPTFRLLEIIENEKDYQLPAVEAATRELESRKDIEQARIELQDKKNRTREKAEAQLERQKEITDKTSNILEQVNPLTKKTPEKLIMLLCIALGALFIYKSMTAFHFILFEFRQVTSGDLYACWFIVEYLYLPLTILLLWKKLKPGWTMFMIWLVYCIATDLSLLYLSFKPATLNDAIMNVTPGPGLSGYLFALALHAGLLILMCKQSIRKLFYSKKTSTDSGVLDVD